MKHTPKMYTSVLPALQSVIDPLHVGDITRGTFYAHYQDTRAVIEQFENEIIEKMIEFLGEFQFQNFFQNPLPLLLKISRYLEDDLEVYRILINSNGSEQFLIKLKKLFVQHMETDTEGNGKIGHNHSAY